MQIANVIATSALAACGLGLWMHAGSALAEKQALEFTPNPLGIKMSPYGQVFAMAIQAPIDEDWSARYGGGGHRCDGGNCDHSSHGETAGEAIRNANPSSRTPLLARLEAAAEERTNPRPPSPAHEYYLRREVEKRLRFAWSLDPSHYANYHSYHLFLSESSVGTREVLRDGWIEHGLNVARFTIDYCLRETHDPRPALTAAAAASNSLELMFFQKESRPLADFENMLAILDLALARHAELSGIWLESGAWENLSPMRLQEVTDRHQFLVKIRQANADAIKRIATTGSKHAGFPSTPDAAWPAADDRN